jgi:hypothetical protein
LKLLFVLLFEFELPLSEGVTKPNIPPRRSVTSELSVTAIGSPVTGWFWLAKDVTERLIRVMFPTLPVATELCDSGPLLLFPLQLELLFEFCAAMVMKPHRPSSLAIKDGSGITGLLTNVPASPLDNKYAKSNAEMLEASCGNSRCRSGFRSSPAVASFA